MSPPSVGRRSAPSSPSSAPGWVRAYVGAVEWLAIAAVAAMTMVAGLQVFFRYVLADSLAWSEELMRYLMIWTAYLCAGMAYTRGEMLGMRFIVDALPSPVRVAVDWIGRILVVVLLVVIAWYGWQFALRTSSEQATALPLSMLWVHASVPVGASLLAAHVLLTGYFRGLGLVRGESSHALS